MSGVNLGRRTKTGTGFGASFGTADDLKMVKRNPKFADIKGTMAGKTGKHSGNVKIKVDRKGELFKRVKRTTLKQLIQAHADTEESIYDLNSSDILSVTTVDDEDERKLKEKLVDTDYLILDLRDPDQYAECHIEGAVNFPAVLLRQDKFPPQVYSFKSKPGRIIVIYAEDESKVGAETANMFLQKDWDNVFLLTGGISYFAQKYPRRCFGTIPSSWGVEQPSSPTGSQEVGSGRISPRSNMRRAQAQAQSKGSSSSSSR